MADKKNEVCRDFLRGTCTRGSKCKYAHVSSTEAALSGLSFRADKPIEFCHDFQNGRCNRPTCKYIHCSKEEEEEFRRSGKLPAQLGGEMSAYQAIPTASSRRTLDSREHDAFIDFGGALMPLGGAQFLAGNAASQKNAAFAIQSVQAFQQAAAFPQFSQAAVSEDLLVEVCKDNLAGRCTRGSRCKFRHVTRSQFEYESQLHDATRRNVGLVGEHRRKRSRSRSRSSRSRSRSSSREGRARRALAGIGAGGSLVDPVAAAALGVNVSAMLNLPASAQQNLLNVNQAVNAGLFGMSSAMQQSASNMLSMGLDPTTGLPMYLTMQTAGAGANLNQMFSAGGAGLQQTNANVGVGDPFSYATNSQTLISNQQSRAPHQVEYFWK